MPLTVFLLLLLTQLPVLYLDADLKRAQHILRAEHGVWLSKENKPYSLKVFEPYARMSLTNITFSSKQKDKYTIKCWQKRGKPLLQIYLVETTYHVDSTFVTANYKDLTGKQTIEHTHIVTDFSYRTYIINDGKKPQLVFTIAATKGDHLFYSVGKHNVSLTYESIPVGLQIPDEKEILKIITHDRP